MKKLTGAFNLTENELRKFAENAVIASFADDETKLWLMEEIKNNFDLI